MTTKKEILYHQDQFNKHKDDILERKFDSDEQAIRAGLKSGDLYFIARTTAPYFLPEGIIKQVQ